MADVVGLRGLPVPSDKEPNVEVVEVLEKYLALARAGQLRGVAFVFWDLRDGLTTGWSGDSDNRIMLSGVATLQYRLAKNFDEQ